MVITLVVAVGCVGLVLVFVVTCLLWVDGCLVVTLTFGVVLDCILLSWCLLLCFGLGFGSLFGFHCVRCCVVFGCDADSLCLILLRACIDCRLCDYYFDLI